MKNYVQDGDAITVTAPASVNSGDGVLIGAAFFGVAKDGAAMGEPVVISTQGVFTLPADAGVMLGDALEWDGSGVATVSAGQRIGVAVSAVAGGVCEVLIG